MVDHSLDDAAAQVPPGPWAVGVSGGADSVALLSLLRDRPDLSPVVVHLNHQTRGEAGEADAQFVGDLARRWGIPCVIALRSHVEAELSALPQNPSARFRAARLALFRRVVTERGLQGVLLAHHADDDAETVLQRLLRGAGPSGLAGIAPRSVVGKLVILRPLLGVRREALRARLECLGLTWRDDASNASDKYLRNRLRRLLASRLQLRDELIELARACRALRDWVRNAAPEPAETLPVSCLRELPPLLARETARRWLIARGAPAGELAPAVLFRLLDMAADAASSPRQHFPGKVFVQRHRGVIEGQQQ